MNWDPFWTDWAACDPRGRMAFFYLWKDIECVKLKLFGIYISSWLFRQAANDRVLGMYGGEVDHTCTLLKAKSFSFKTGMGFFLSVVSQRVQVRLYTVPLVSSAVTEGFQWHRAAFQNKLVFISLLGWHVEQGHICVAKLNLRWSQWGLKQPGISKPVGVLSVSQCVKSLPQLHTSGHSFSICSTTVVTVLPPPAPDANLWTLESSVTSPRCSSGSGSAPGSPSAANKTYCGKYCFPRQVFYMQGSFTCLQVAKQSLLWVPQHPILSTFAVLSDSWCPLECSAVCKEQLWKQGRLVTLWPLPRAQVLWVTAKAQCTLPARVKWWNDGFVNQRVLLGEVDGFVLLSFWWHGLLQQQL